MEDAMNASSKKDVFERIPETWSRGRKSFYKTSSACAADLAGSYQVIR